MTRRIDAHQHFWSMARGDYRWLSPDLAPLYRDFGPADLAPELARHAIDATVLVQAADSAAETEFLLAIAERTPFVAGVVGWIDFEARDAPDRLAALAAHRRCVGVRPMLQDLADDAWMLSPELAPVFTRLVELDLVFDALVKPRHLAHLVRLVARHPEMKVVLDHGAKPEIVHGLDWPGLQNWRKNLRELARNPRVHCKLSGLVTEAAPQWSVPDIRPYFDDLTGAFGVRRLIWGSDWPVVELARGYGAWHAAAEELCRALRSDERAAVFGGNAETLYGLPGSHRA